VDFVKMEGLGNDFVVVDGPIDVTADDVRRWCDRRRGIGAHGVLEVTPVDGGTVRMRYWNADGGAAEMCGNGLRCVALLAHLRGWVDSPSFVVDTEIGERPVEVRPDGTVRALLGWASGDGGFTGSSPGGEETGLEGGGVEMTAVNVHGVDVHRVSVGNPHAVTFVDEQAGAPVGEIGPLVERDPIFPLGTNVEFATVVAPDRIAVRVWERGVGETQACGTGAAATAYAGHRLGLTDAKVIVDLLGGPLLVDLHDDEAWIEGPATVVFTGSFD
jgi:diaminopimelate epimerase